MSLNIGSAVTNGLGRVGNRNGAVLIVVAAAIGVAWQVAVMSAFAQFVSPPMAGSTGLTIDAPIALLGLVGLVVFLLLSYVTIVAMRTFVAGEAEQIPREFLRRRIPWTVANLVVGGIAFSLITFLGTLLLVVPGIIAYVSLLFMSLYVAVDDENFVAAMIDSWHLTRGNWIRLFVLLVIIVVPLTIALTILSTGISLTVGPNSAASQVLSGGLSMAFSIAILGVLAEAFVQLRAGRDPGVGSDAPEADRSRTT